MTMSITVIGTDYEGLTIAAGLATLGHKVTSVDTSASRARRLQRGVSVEGDPELTSGMKSVLREGYLKFTSEPETCLAEADVVIIAEIPGNKEERTAILRTAECLSGAIASYSTVLVTAGVPTGSCRILQEWLADALYTSAAHVVACPVFFEKPNGLEQFISPERIVLGYESERSRRTVDELFARMLQSDPMVTHVSWEAAEMMRAPATPFAPAVPEAGNKALPAEKAIEDAREKIYVRINRN
jgi:UDPglucose 6-dehydrogenase